MNMELAKVLDEFLLTLCTDVFEVLITEHNYASLCNEQSKFVFLRICELRELDSADLSADTRRQADQRYAWMVQQVWFRFVCIQTAIPEFEGLDRW
jgi:hypothetical protein